MADDKINAKISMSLDDVVKTDKAQRKPKAKPQKKAAPAPKAARGGRGGAAGAGGRGGAGAARGGRGGFARGGGPGPVRNQGRGGGFRAQPYARGGYNGHDDRGNRSFERAQPLETRRREEKPMALSTGSKLLVSNLDPEVTKEDLQDVFSKPELGGPLKKCVVFFDENGNSLSTGEVIFVKSADAQKAFSKLQGVPLDGLPLKLALIK